MTIGLSDGTSHESELDLLLSSSEMGNMRGFTEPPILTRQQNSQQMKESVEWNRRNWELLPAGSMDDTIEPTKPGTPIIDPQGAGRNVYIASQGYGYQKAEPEVDKRTPLNFTSRYNTDLGGDLSQESINYSKWLGKTFPGGTSEDQHSFDYDMQGFYKSTDGTEHTPNTHFPDTYKKPNHPTFSEESIYHGQDIYGSKAEGGRWEQNPDKSYNFFPGKTNLDMHGPQGLIDYFKAFEPGNKLILPSSSLKGLTQLAANIDPRNNPYSKEKLGEGAGGTIPTRVDRTALKYKDKVYTGDKGNSHFELMDKVPKDAKFTEVEDGFVTNTGKFLTRHEANMLTGKNEQLPLEQFKQNIQQGRGLISEDLPEINAARWEKRINMMEEMQKKSSRWDDLMPSDEFSSFVKELRDFVNTNVLKKR